MKKIILLAGLVGGGVVLSATAFANDWLLYLPAILQGKQEVVVPDPPVALGEMNDTGIVTGVGVEGVCTAGEDCNYGRDASSDTNADDDGYKGFSFTKLNSAGQVTTDASWSCVLDNVTGLIWEVKSGDDDSLHYGSDTYSWYNTDSATNGGQSGAVNPTAVDCQLYQDDNSTYCNTAAYIAKVNNVGLCGANDWRLPTVQELLSIVSYDAAGNTGVKTVDTNYFPNIIGNLNFWAATPSAQYDTDAWRVNFEGGYTAISTKDTALLSVRLVRKPVSN
jgi:hypothetical protein